MAFLNSFNIAASGMTAQRRRLDVVAENISNINSTRTEDDGGPYTRKMVVFQPIAQSDFKDTFNTLQKNTRRTIGRDTDLSQGVMVTEIIEDDTDYKTVYDPTHPDADEAGYVLYPNVEILKETTDAMAASRAYEANVTAFNAIKAMAAKGMEIGR
ncbi:MAG: flagellar basal body rod protein FlgC [Bacillota bacterium]